MAIYQSHEGSPNYLQAAEATPVFDLAGAVTRGMQIADQMTLSQQQIEANAQNMRANELMLPYRIQEAQSKARAADDEMRAFELTHSADVMEAQKNAKIAEAKAQLDGLNNQAEATSHINDLYQLKSLAQNDPASYLAARDGLLSVVGKNPVLRSQIDQIDSAFDEADYAGSDNKTTQKGSYLRSLYQKQGDLSAFHGTTGMSQESLAVLKFQTGRNAQRTALIAQGFTPDRADQMLSVQDKQLDVALRANAGLADSAMKDLNFLDKQVSKLNAASSTMQFPDVAMVDPDRIGKVWTFTDDRYFQTVTESMLNNINKQIQGAINQIRTGQGDNSQLPALELKRKENEALARQLRNPTLGVSGLGGDVISAARNWLDYDTTGLDTLEQLRPIYDSFAAARKSNNQASTKAALEQLSDFMWTRAPEALKQGQMQQKNQGIAQAYSSIAARVSGAGSAFANAAPNGVPSFGSVAEMDASMDAGMLPAGVPVIVAGKPGRSKAR